VGQHPALQVVHEDVEVVVLAGHVMEAALAGGDFLEEGPAGVLLGEVHGLLHESLGLVARLGADRKREDRHQDGNEQALAHGNLLEWGRRAFPPLRPGRAFP
jgi:hypothetical protein